ncbi:MAG TPA: hypothetical protein VLB68_25800 [Pyrinomonadaceae bacterium]|nr:hypothetical protein [Pyrinomonadaceae bacterium]
MSLLIPQLVLLIAFSLMCTTVQKTAQKSETQSVSTWVMTDDNQTRRIEIRGKAEFNDEYTDIVSVSEGGSVRVEEKSGGLSRRYEVRNANNQLSRTYYVSGSARPIDDNAKKWIAQLVLEAVRQGGFDADVRVQRILSRGGIKAVLAEIDLIHSDYAKRLYFQSLIKHGVLDVAGVQDLLRQAARQISSDYEQAELLVAIAPIMVGKEGATTAYFSAVNTINSDYEHGRVLTAVLKTLPANRELLIQVAESTKTIHSDYEKAGVLKRAAGAYVDDPALRKVFFQTISSIESDYEHRSVLSALLKSKGLNSDLLSSLLESATTLSSDYEKATFLLEASNAYSADPVLKNAFLKAVESIKSEYERGRVLSTLLKNKQIG